MKKNIYIITITLIILSIITLIFFDKLKLSNSNNLLKDNSVSSVATSSISSDAVAEKIAKSTDDIPADYIKYTNIKYSFSLFHSPQSKITEYDQGQGAMIITVENEQNAKGMQIFIVPYWEKTISEARFKADIPSGVRTDIEKTYVDGVEAVTFHSFDESLGPTREVWFIRGGYLYEVTTFQGIADWFVPKMQTWLWR